MAKDIKLGIVINQSGNAAKNIGGISSILGKLGGIAGGVLTGGLVLAGAGVVALGAGLVSSVGAAMEAQEGQAQLAAVLKSTAGVSGMTVDSINDLAASLQKVTPFSDDAILAGENLLLTFTNIGKDVFPMATETMLDMAAALGTDAPGAAIQLGKALNDPIAGIGALSRVGVTFTDGQKDMIKSLVESGDVIGAQKIILAELSKEFGGSAKAAGETLPGKLEILKNTFGDIQEAIGGAFLPILSEVTDAFTTGLNSEFVQGALKSLTDFITGTVVPGIKTAGEIFGQIFSDFSRYILAVVEDGDYLNDWLTHLPDFFQPIAFAIGQTIAIVQGILLAFQDFRAGVMGVDYPWEDVFPPWLADIMYTVSGIIFDTVIPAFETVRTFITGQLVPGLQLLGKWITDLALAVWPLLVQAGQFVIDNFNIIGPAIAAVGATILALSSPITALIAAAVLLATAWANNWGGIQERTAAVLDFLRPKFADLQLIFNRFIAELLPALQEAWATLTGVWTAEVGPALSELWLSLNTLLEALGFSTEKTDGWKVALGILKGTLDAVVIVVRLLTPLIRAYSTNLTFMIGQVRTSIDNFVRFKNGVEGIYNSVSRLIGKIKDLASQLASLVIPGDWLGHSPSPFEMSLKGIESAAKGVVKVVPGMVGQGTKPAAPALASTPGALAGAVGAGGAGLVINFTYSPVISLADRFEAQNVLAPFIAEGVRAALAKKVGR